MMLLQKLFCGLVLVSICAVHECFVSAQTSAVGDPGMRREGLRVAIEAWNQCNEVGEEAPNMGSPRCADCFDLYNSTSPIRLVHRVTERDNKLGISNATSRGRRGPLDVNQYAAWKQIYLGTKCQVQGKPKPWQFWMIMLKSGNMDTLAAICPNNGRKAYPFKSDSVFPCFGKGCMNMPLIYHDYTTVYEDHGSKKLRGSFYGTWDLDNAASVTKELITQNDSSYYEVIWEKEVGKRSWEFHLILKTSLKYPWLMLYLRADAATGFSGGYHYQTRGIMKTVR